MTLYHAAKPEWQNQCREESGRQTTKMNSNDSCPLLLMSCLQYPHLLQGEPFLMSQIQQW